MKAMLRTTANCNTLCKHLATKEEHNMMPMKHY